MLRKKNLINLVFGGMFAFLVASPVMAVTTPQVSSVSAAGCEDRFLGIPPWYRGLTKNAYPDCALVTPNGGGSNGVDLSAFIWTIVLNIIEMAVVASAYAAAFFILYGGFLFMTGGSNPSMIEKGRKTILNAVIGLIIAMGAIGIINLVFSIIP